MGSESLADTLVLDYPEDDKATEAIGVCWSIATGVMPSKAKLINAEWVLQGYLCKIGVPRIFPVAQGTADPVAAMRALIQLKLEPHKIGDGTLIKIAGNVLKELPLKEILLLLLQMNAAS